MKRQGNFVRRGLRGIDRNSDEQEYQFTRRDWLYMIAGGIACAIWGWFMIVMIMTLGGAG